MLSIATRKLDDAFGSPDFVGGWAVLVSAFIHMTALAIGVVLSDGQTSIGVIPDALSPRERVVSHIVFLTPAERGRSGGGGGGGNRQSGAIRRAESVGHDRTTLRVRKPIGTTGRLIDAEPSVPAPVLDARPLASGIAEHLGLPGGGVTFGASTGPGSGGGVGDGVGTGIGSGRGSGLGPGSGGGTGGGIYRVGGAVTSPQVLLEVRPTYTATALRERIQGSVVLELVVTMEGRPSGIRVIRSLDPGGLDDEAIKAARQWRFVPGRLSGKPVDVLVTIVLDFTIH